MSGLYDRSSPHLHFEVTTELDHVTRRNSEIIRRGHHVPVQRDKELGCNRIPETMMA